jgi:tetratricopeptide (TPR) repeat protein
MPSAGPDQAPASYQTSRRWLPLLAAAGGWLPLLHLGVVLAHSGDLPGATDAWLRSVADQPTPWALRNLAAAALSAGDLPLAVRRYQAAVELRGDLAPLRRELVDTLLAAQEGEQALAAIEAAPEVHRHLGRFRLAEVRAAVLSGDLDRAGLLLRSGLVLPDVREGEPSLHEVWFDYQAALAARDQHRPIDAGLVAQVRATVPVPADLDFRMQ